MGSCPLLCGFDCVVRYLNCTVWFYCFGFVCLIVFSLVALVVFVFVCLSLFWCYMICLLLLVWFACVIVGALRLVLSLLGLR